jgi:hypothetical protein
MISPSYSSIHGLFVWAVVEKQMYLVGYYKAAESLEAKNNHIRPHN